MQARVNPGARIADCGGISAYDPTAPRPTRNLRGIVGRRAKLQGFMAGDHMAKLAGYVAEMPGRLKDGRIRYRADVVWGLENAPAAFIGMPRGDSIGKRPVQIAADPAKRRWLPAEELFLNPEYLDWRAALIKMFAIFIYIVFWSSRILNKKPTDLVIKI